MILWTGGVLPTPASSSSLDQEVSRLLPDRLSNRRVLFSSSVVGWAVDAVEPPKGLRILDQEKERDMVLALRLLLASP